MAVASREKEGCLNASRLGRNGKDSRGFVSETGIAFLASGRLMEILTGVERKGNNNVSAGARKADIFLVYFEEK